MSEMSSEPVTNTPVLIIGAGVAGLTSALFLSHHGIHSQVIERHSGTSIHPRARGVNMRTMELFRHLRLDDAVREAGASLSASTGILSGSSLKEVIEQRRRKDDQGKLLVGKLTEGVSPVKGTFVTQDMLEPVLVDALKERGGEIRFYTECLGVQQDDTAVTATIRDRKTGATSTIQAKYLIAADGAKSPIRTTLDVPLLGRGTMGHLLNVLFRADLKPLVHQREFSLCIVERPEVTGLFAAINNNDRWVFHLSYDPAKGETPNDFPPGRCKELLRVALGIPEIEIEIESVMPWEPSVRVAAKMRHGRIFLMGDSAHQMPPYGGQGATSGIADAHNLAWKLAAVLQKHASPAILDTYDEERQPVGLNAAEASASMAGGNSRGLISPKNKLAIAKGLWNIVPLGSGHGYAYKSKAIREENTWPLRGATWRPWTFPSLFLAIDGRPGRRAPHVWVERQGKRISTLDISAKSFVLLAGFEGTAWVEAARRVSNVLAVTLEAYCIGAESELVAPDYVFEAAAGISSRGAILIRPDDFVAWRERRGPENCQFGLEAAVRQALCLE